MATYAFFNMPAYGHVNYTLTIVQELIARGQHVIYYLTDDFQESIESTGASFFAYQKRSNTSHLDGVSTIRMIVNSLLSEKPDFIVYDYMSAWASLLAKALGIPAISTRCTYAMNDAFGWLDMNRYTSPIWLREDQQSWFSARSVERHLQRQIAQICQAIDVPTSVRPQSPLDLYRIRETLNIICIPRSFQPRADTFDESYLFVGPAITPRPFQGDFPFERLRDDKPLIYMTLGTLFNDRVDILKTCIKALGNTQWQVVLSRGQKNIAASLGPVPRNILVANYVPQLDVLARANIFISHAGISSVVESLYVGIPMIAIPQIPEHAIAAERIQDLGLGIAWNPDTITADQVRESVERIAQDPSFLQNHQNMPSESKDGKGYVRAVDAMLKLAREPQTAIG